ncbi:FecCD family ABC transporter permease [Anaerobranca gottschalkii]|uniref:Iron complex transport system permease protein n=1 Tax=Anaerobranca gottschalkii DSM 13577 TaxID=1120990 RepID=A0A1H9YEM0_9FIRM|nr:iron ABC transporter permease [Anaerobranca gottschalkii]SES67017.1 iron complex transport system permease protein [Anaerobranca gottschalkii DSM 13577]
MKKTYLFTIIILFSVLILGVAFGATPISLREIFLNSNTTYYVILYQMRMPRVVLSMLVGGVLAGCGVAFQSILKNPLAEPYTLGVSSGAGLGATLAMTFLVNYRIYGLSTITFFSFLFAIFTVILVYFLAKSQGSLNPLNLILAGVVISSTFSAFISFIMIYADDNIRQIFFWLMGNLQRASWDKLKIIIIPAVIGLILIALKLKELNLLLLGDEEAASLGVEVEKTKKIIILGATLATASVVSISGLIGFVGLIVPHTLRLIFGGDNLKIYPLSILWGGIFLTLADLIGRIILVPREIPVGIITALTGGPFFLFLLKQKAKRE